MKKVLFITGFFPYRQGGAEYQAFFLAEYLKNSYEISFVFRDHWQKGKNGTLHHGDFTLYPIEPVKILGVSKPFLFEIRQFYHCLEEIAPDAIYVRGANAFLGVAAHYASQRSVQVIWHIASDNDLLPFQPRKIKSLPFDFVGHKVNQYGIRQAHCIVAQTRYQDKLLGKMYGRSCDEVIGNWHPVPDEIEKEDREIWVLWIANWKPIKQPEIFVNLVSSFVKKQNVRFMMFGRTDQYPELLTQAQALGIEVMGEVSNEQVNDALAKSHILVNTSIAEGFSNTFIQAWMRNVPVVSLQVDPDDILQKGEVGFCSGSFEKLVTDTARLIDDHELRNQMGKKAREHAVKNHSLDNLSAILRILESGLYD